MTEKRFIVCKVIGSFHEWSIEDNIDDKVVFHTIINKYEADRLCDKLNELDEENKQLKRIIEENEKVINSMNDELIKLRMISESLKGIDAKWKRITKLIQYV